MSKHTPGPWKVNAFGSTQVWKTHKYGRNEVRTQIANVNPDDFHQFTERGKEAEANARLIAEAPAMLTALKAAKDALRSYQHGNSAPDLAEEIANFADKVIAEAEGR
jgi:hypothetical protein